MKVVLLCGDPGVWICPIRVSAQADDADIVARSHVGTIKRYYAHFRHTEFMTRPLTNDRTTAVVLPEIADRA